MLVAAKDPLLSHPTCCVLLSLESSSMSPLFCISHYQTGLRHILTVQFPAVQFPATRASTFWEWTSQTQQPYRAEGASSSPANKATMLTSQNKCWLLVSSLLAQMKHTKHFSNPHRPAPNWKYVPLLQIDSPRLIKTEPSAANISPNYLRRRAPPRVNLKPQPLYVGLGRLCVRT